MAKKDKKVKTLHGYAVQIKGGLTSVLEELNPEPMRGSVTAVTWWWSGDVQFSSVCCVLVLASAAKLTEKYDILKGIFLELHNAILFPFRRTLSGVFGAGNDVSVDSTS